MIEWIAAKLAGSTAKIVVIVMALFMPVCALGWAWEGVSLHGIEIPFPFFGPFHLVDGAIHGRELAEKARDKALGDLVIANGNTDRVRAALDESNASIASLKAESDQRTAAANAALAAEQAKRADLARRLKILDGFKIDTSSPGAAAISLDKLISGGGQ